MKPITTIAATMMVILPASLWAQDAAEDTFAGHDVFFTISGGVVSAPSFLGSGETSVYAFPNISVAIGDRLNISLLDGVSYDVYKDDYLTAGAVLTYDVGREDSPSDHDLQLSKVADSEIFQHHLHETRARNAILIFVSWEEKYVTIVADKGINERVQQSDWDDLISGFVNDIKADKLADGFLSIIGGAGALLTENFPVQSPKTDELPNHLIELDTAPYIS